MKKSEKGQAVVELALSIPILILILFGTIDFGRIFYTYMTLEHSSRESARIASVGADNQSIIQQAILSADTLNQEKLDVSILPETGRVRGSYVTVTTSYSVEIFTPFLEIIIPNPFLISGETMMRIE